jgi:hypothetical protein
MPKSVIQTSPGLTAGIFVFHAVEQLCSVQGGLVTSSDFRILIGDFQELLADRSPFGFCEARERLDYFGHAHAVRLNDAPVLVSDIFLNAFDLLRTQTQKQTGCS